MNIDLAEYDNLTEESRKHAAEAENFRVQADSTRLHVKMDELRLASLAKQEAFANASDVDNRIYRFSDEFTAESAENCYAFLSRWARMDPSLPVEIQLTSPGGSAWHGMALFDQTVALRHKYGEQGFRVRITVRGTAASMAAIYLQAADERVMGPNSTLLVHKASTELSGTLDQIEDAKAWLDLMHNQTLDIFCQRTGKSKQQVSAWFNRKDSSFGPQAALAAGLIDQVA